jgi:hypothetical protein
LSAVRQVAIGLVGDFQNWGDKRPDNVCLPEMVPESDLLVAVAG